MTEEEEDEANDESKIFYNHLGYTNLSIDDVFKHYLMTGEMTFAAVKPIYLDNEDLDSSQQNGIMGQSPSDGKGSNMK